MVFKSLANHELLNQYPKDLKLEIAHIFFRHGARTPTSPLFTELGLPVYWPLCSGIHENLSTVHVKEDYGLHRNILPWKRLMERTRVDDGPELSNTSFRLCNHGELTDHGRNSMVQLGRDLRKQYITGLSLFPSMLSNPSYVYFRSSPFPRALESLQHVIWGMFPPESRTPDFGSVNIVQRGERDETLLPNEDYCVRFIHIFKAYTERASNRWNNSDEMKYINALIGKYVPQGPITVAGAPKIHAIYDIITSTIATDNIRLPEAFYDEKLGDIVDRLAYNEEFGSYGENKEMRTVGIGAMLADVVERVVSKVEHEAISASQACSTNDDHTESTGVESNGTKLWLYGSHDSTLGAVMAGLGADEVIEGERRWPPYGSVLAVEVFRDMKDEGIISQPTSSVPGFLSDMRHHPISRTPTRRLSQAQKARLRNYYIRLRYNNRSLTIPGCKLAGKNWNEDATFCTLEAFKEIVDHFTPSNWRRECGQNLSKGLPDIIDPAGY